MGYLSQELAIDLGTANTIIIYNNRIVVDEPSIVAINKKTKELIAAGNKVRRAQSSIHEHIKIIRPFQDGVIADFYAAEILIGSFIKMISPENILHTPALRLVVSIPSGSSEIEVCAIRDSLKNAGAKDFYIIYKPILAAALGIGLDIKANKGNMIIDIGGGTTEVAVISRSEIVLCRSVRIAGDELTSDIKEYMSNRHNINICEWTAEEIKINTGAALPDIKNPPPDFPVKGTHQVTNLPIEVPVSYKEIAHCLDKSLSRIEAAVLMALEEIPPELKADVFNNGIYLVGGGALIRGLDKRLSDKLNIPVRIAKDPLHAVARGAVLALKNIDKFSFLRR